MGAWASFCVSCYLVIVFDARDREVTREHADFFADGFELRVVVCGLHDLENPVADLTDVVFLHAASGEGWGSEADAAGVERLALIVGDHVFIDGDACVIQSFFSHFAGQADGSDVSQDEVVVGSAGDESDAPFGEDFREGFGIVNDLLAISFEVILEGFVEADGFAGDDVHQRSALKAWEDGFVEIGGVFFLAQDHA